MESLLNAWLSKLRIPHIQMIICLGEGFFDLWYICLMIPGRFLEPVHASTAKGIALLVILDFLYRHCHISSKQDDLKSLRNTMAYAAWWYANSQYLVRTYGSDWYFYIATTRRGLAGLLEWLKWIDRSRAWTVCSLSIDDCAHGGHCSSIRQEHLGPPALSLQARLFSYLLSHGGIVTKSTW